MGVGPKYRDHESGINSTCSIVTRFVFGRRATGRCIEYAYESRDAEFESEDRGRPWVDSV